MKDVIIKVYSDGSVYTAKDSLGINYENLQGKLKFIFVSGIVKGTAYLEFERNDEKGYILMDENDQGYEIDIKSSLLKEQGNISLQLRITEDENPNGTPIYKTKIVTLEVLEAINATAEIPDEYPEWIDIANEKIKEMDNLNITTERVEDGVDIVLTDKKGNVTRTEVKDGEKGDKGDQGEPGAVKMQVVDTLPETGETDTIYLVKKDKPGEQNLYDEYVYTDTGWEHIGDTSVDLSDYYTKEETDERVSAKASLYYWTEGTETSETIATFQNMINDLANGGNPILTTNYNNDTSITANYNIMGTILYTFPTDIDISSLPSFTGTIVLRRNGYRSLAVDHGQVRPTWVYYRILVTLNNGTVTGVDGPFRSTAFYNNNSWERTDDPTDILCIGNTIVYTPTTDYHPATKKYVDDTIDTAAGVELIGEYTDNTLSVSLLNGNGKQISKSDIEIPSNSEPHYLWDKTTDDNAKELFQSVFSAYKNGKLLNVDLDDNGKMYKLTNISQPNNLANEYWCQFRTIDWYTNSTDMVFLQTVNAVLEVNGSIVQSISLKQSINEFRLIREYDGTNGALPTNNTLAFTPNMDYEPATKLYVDTTHYQRITGYDSTKTQTLKHVNGIMQWVNE